MSEKTGELPNGSIPTGMRIAAGWSWRLVAIAAALALIGYVIVQIRIVVIPFVIALLIAALLNPLVDWLQRKHKWPRVVAVILSEIGLIAIIGGLFTVVFWQISLGIHNLQTQAMKALDDARNALMAAPFNLTNTDLNHYYKQVLGTVQQDSHVLVQGVLSVGSTAGHFGAGLLLVLFSTIFLLLDGRRIFHWVIGLTPKRAQLPIGFATKRGWHSLSSYVKVQILVAAIDAVGIGVGATILQLPLVIPLAIFVFLMSFIPFVGAILSGALVCLVALIFHGWVPALIMLGIVIVVQQIESHVLQPFIMGSAVRVHPLGVVLAVAIGTMLAGIPGALFAVPVVAVANTMIGTLVRKEWLPADAGAAVEVKPTI